MHQNLAAVGIAREKTLKVLEWVSVYREVQQDAPDNASGDHNHPGALTKRGFVILLAVLFARCVTVWHC
jgi:hypothetical protein